MRSTPHISSEVEPAQPRDPLQVSRGLNWTEGGIGGAILSGDTTRSSAIHVLAFSVGIAALAEFLLLRIGLRLGAVVPYETVMEIITRLFLLLGTAALNFAVLGGTLLVFLLLVRRYRARSSRWGERRGRLLSAGASWLTTAAFMAALLAAGWYLVLAILPLVGQRVPAGELLAPHLLLFSALAATAIVGYAWAGLGRSPSAGRGLLLLAGSFLLVLHYGVAAQSITIFGQALPGAATALALAEVLIVATVLWSPIALRPRPCRSSVMLTAVITAIAGALLFGAPWIARTISIWTVAFTLYLPSLIYIIAAAIGTFTLASVLFERTGVNHARKMQAIGLFLLLTGGMKPDFSYLAVLGAVGLLLLSMPKAAENHG